MQSNFVKMHGTGNDFIIVEPSFFEIDNKRDQQNTFSHQEIQKISKTTKKLCRKNFGIGADGILVISLVSQNQYKMSVFNSDGSMGLMCGNGLRCVAAYLSEIKKLGNEFMVSTDSGNKLVTVQKDSSHLFYVEINLNTPTNFSKLDQKFTYNNQNQITDILNIDLFICSLGNDHIVIFFTELQFKAIEQANAYAQISAELIKIRKANVNFCLIQSKESLKVVTCELGAGVTFACGTGSTASAYVGFILGLLQDRATVHTRGGDIRITTVEVEGKHQVYMKGPAEFVYTGFINCQYD